MTDNVINFPSKGFKPRPVMSAEEEQKLLLLNNKRIADNTAEGLAVDILTVLQEHISNMQKDNFIADLAFLIEVVKATLHRENYKGSSQREIYQRESTMRNWLRDIQRIKFTWQV